MESILQTRNLGAAILSDYYNIVRVAILKMHQETHSIARKTFNESQTYIGETNDQIEAAREYINKNSTAQYLARKLKKDYTQALEQIRIDTVLEFVEIDPSTANFISKYRDVAEASDEALANAIDLIKPNLEKLLARYDLAKSRLLAGQEVNQ